MGIPSSYERILEDVRDEDFDERTAAMTPDEISASLHRGGMTDERLSEMHRGQRDKIAASMGQKLIDRLCWMTRAERDAWLAREEHSAEQEEEIRGIWAQTLAELQAAGKLSQKLRAELEAEPARPAKPGVTALERATELHRAWLPSFDFDETP